MTHFDRTFFFSTCPDSFNNGMSGMVYGIVEQRLVARKEKSASGVRTPVEFVIATFAQISLGNGRTQITGYSGLPSPGWQPV